MEAYLLNIGNEVLSGKVVNTNASFLAQELEKLGIDVSKTIVVGDDKQAIKDCVYEFINTSAKMLITTGGLGPTHDDFTKEVIAEALSLKMEYNERAAEDMFMYFGEAKTDCNVKQAYFPEDSFALANKNGSADGAIIEYLNKIIILLVGPPNELKPMFNDMVVPYLQTKGQKKLIKDLLVIGNSEAYFENQIIPILKRFPNIEIAPYANTGNIRIRMQASLEDEEDFNLCLDCMRSLFTEYLISEDNQEIQEVVVNLLLSKGLMISCAESMTGGMISEYLTQVPNVSKVFSQSIITYSEQAKIKHLQLTDELITTHGVVSTEVTEAMVLGLFELTNADICVAVSGYAGPSGDDVGRVCFSIKYQDQILSETKLFKGTRAMIRTRATRYILYRVYILAKDI